MDKSTKKKEDFTMLFSSPFDDSHPLYYRITNNLQLRRFYAVEFGYGSIPPGLRQIHTRNIYIIHYITVGKGCLWGKQFNKDHAYIIHPNEEENFISDVDEPYEAYWIMFNGSDTKEILRTASLPLHNDVFTFSENKKCADIIHHILFNMKANNVYEEAYLMQSALYEIFAIHMHSVENAPQYSTSPEEQIKKYIDDNYFRDVQIKELMKNMQISRTSAFNAFKKAYKTTPNEYLLHLRLEKSKELLINKLNNFSINEISQIVGFNDPLYFSRIFKQKIGIPPSEFRKRFYIKSGEHEKFIQ